MNTSVKSTVRPSYKRDYFIYVPKKDWDLFPAFTTVVELETDKSTIRTQFYVGSYRGFSRNLKPWFEAHPELEAGDTLCITVREPGRRYRLEIQPKKVKDLLP
jgi:hypothetical protein